MGFRLAHAAVFLLVASAAASAGAAATITTFDRAGFAAALAGSGARTQTFDDLALGVLTATDGITYTATGGNVVVTAKFLSSSGLNSLGSGTGDKQQFFLADQRVTFTFAAALTAFAIDINTFVTAAMGAFTATLDTGDVVQSRFAPFGLMNPDNGAKSVGTGQFIGFTSDTPFTSVTVAGTTGNADDTFNLDTLVGLAYVAPLPPDPQPSGVPLPATLPLLAVGLAALLCAPRRAGRQGCISPAA